MNKPDSAGAKSLEEILASIRRSLAEETPDRAPEAKPAPANPAPQPAAEPAFPGKDAASLSGTLSGALNRSSANGPALDEDLAALLAPEPQKPAPASAETGQSEAGRETKDPLWFLRSKTPATESKSNGAQAPSPPLEPEVKLTRPQDLRASLPP